VTKNEIITKTLAEMSQHFCDDGGAECGHDEEPDYEELVIATLREQLPDDDVNTCEDFEGLKAQCCETCHRFYPHYDMYLESLPTGAKAWLCCAARAALLQSSTWDDIPTADAAIGSSQIAITALLILRIWLHAAG
jgi:hypothetical protein